jgi:hypothetical protein
MFVTRFPCKRLLAGLMPLCLLWLFVACVSLCAAHEDAEHEHAMLSAEIESDPASESCPVLEAPKGMLAERTNAFPRDEVQASSALFAEPLSRTEARVRDSVFHSSTDPPFERLRTLRI